MDICIDGRLAAMSGGTGVSVYGAALAETVGLLGHVVEGLVEGRRSTRFDAWRGALRPGAWPVPLVDGARVGGSLFRSAQIRFDLRGSLLSVRDRADPPAVMHWTYPLPLRFAGVPNVYTVHDLIPLMHPELSPVPQRRMNRLLREVVAAASHIVTVSEASRREIIEFFGLSPDRVTNTYQAVIDQRPSEAVLAQALGDIGLEPGGFVLHAGSVEPRKNVGRLIRAHRESRIARRLVIAGPDGWQAAQELQEAGPGVMRLRWVARPLLIALIAGARFVVVPSLAEGFGLVVAEAMAMGTAVICSDRGALAEVAGGAARFVNPDDTEALAAAMADLDADDATLETMVAAGRCRAALFSPGAYADRLRPVYAAFG